jgi:hypothetical protein
MKESEFIKLNFKFKISNFYANVKVKITSPRTAVRQLANTLTVREFSKWDSTYLDVISNSYWKCSFEYFCNFCVLFYQVYCLTFIFVNLI